MTPVGGQNQYLLNLVTPIAQCFGGAVCLQQPTFKLINTQGQVATTFLGTAFINMGASPSGSEPLYLGPCNINGVCGFQASGTSAFVNIIDGFITFSVSS
jgi:hypothetical protein